MREKMNLIQFSDCNRRQLLTKNFHKPKGDGSSSWRHTADQVRCEVYTGVAAPARTATFRARRGKRPNAAHEIASAHRPTVTRESPLKSPQILPRRRSRPTSRAGLWQVVEMNANRCEVCDDTNATIHCQVCSFLRLVSSRHPSRFQIHCVRLLTQRRAPRSV